MDPVAKRPTTQRHSAPLLSRPRPTSLGVQPPIRIPSQPENLPVCEVSKIPVENEPNYSSPLAALLVADDEGVVVNSSLPEIPIPPPKESPIIALPKNDVDTPSSDKKLSFSKYAATKGDEPLDEEEDEDEESSEYTPIYIDSPITPGVQQPTSGKSSSRKRRILIWLIIGLVALAGLLTGLYFIFRHQLPTWIGGDGGRSSSPASSPSTPSAGPSEETEAYPSPSPSPTFSPTIPQPEPSSNNCMNPYIRREWRELSQSEQTAFFSAVKALKAAPSEIGSSNRYEDFVKIHYENRLATHSQPMFLPWHRHFTLEFELALRKIDPSIILPYWDWALDSQVPERSPILQANTFGGDGDSNSGCIINGQFNGWSSNYPQYHCVARRFNYGNGQIQPWSPPEEVAVLIRSQPNYDSFRVNFESVPHARIHNGIGGNLGDMAFMASRKAANDPLFFVHHANVDRYYSIWQNTWPTYPHYGGVSNVTGQSVPVYPTDDMQPFNMPVSAILNITANSKYCYGYSASISPAPVTSRIRKRYDPKRAMTHSSSQCPVNEKLLLPPPLPDHFIHHMGYDVEQVRAYERRYSKTVVDEVNGDACYTSDASLAQHASIRWKPIEDGMWRFSAENPRNLSSKIEAIVAENFAAIPRPPVLNATLAINVTQTSTNTTLSNSTRTAQNKSMSNMSNNATKTAAFLWHN